MDNKSFYKKKIYSKEKNEFYTGLALEHTEIGMLCEDCMAELER